MQKHIQYELPLKQLNIAFILHLKQNIRCVWSENGVWSKLRKSEIY